MTKPPHARRRLGPILAALSILTSLIAVVPADAAVTQAHAWYIAPGGDDDGAGTIDDPWETIHWSMLKVEPGDTLYLRGGVYNERVGNLKPLPVGRPDAPITMTSYPGERAIIKGGMTLQLGGAHHWIFDSLDFTWDTSLGPNIALVRMVDGSNWTIRNSRIGGNHSYTALRVIASSDGLATGWTIEHNCITNTHPSNGTNSDHNVYIGAGSSYGVAPGGGLIADNVISGAANGSNIKLGGGEPHLPGTHDVIVRDNVLAEAPHNVIVAWNSHNNTIENNVAFQRPNGTWSQPWYPNIRGLDLTGSGNVARDNLGFNDGGVVNNWKSAAHIADINNTPTTYNPTLPADPCEELAPFVGGADRILTDAGATRISGASRVDTAVQLTRQVYDAAEFVIVARADDYADALAASPLAGSLGAPLLLTGREELTAETADTIRELGATTAYLMGGTSALSRAVEGALVDMGLETRRIAGSNRFDTAASVVEHLPDVTSVYVVEGSNASPSRGWPDAVALSPLAARTTTPILLTTARSLPTDTERALRSLADDVSVTIVGGAVAVSDGVAASIEATGALTERAVTRLAGTSRYETSAKVSEAAVSAGMDASNVWLVTGLNWPDALAAGPAAATAGVTMLLGHGTDLDNSPTTVTWVRDNVADPTTGLTIVGGAGAISHFAATEMVYKVS